LRKLEGKRLKAGEWDMYIILLERFHLLPAEVDEQDPSFVDELLVFLEADAQHTRQRMKDAERN